MGFSIRFLSPEEYGPYDQEPDLILGEITIGCFTERFEASTSYWSIHDYQKQWEKALDRTISGEKKSCLITSMYDPEHANFIFWWLLYREGQKVIVQNQILFLNDKKLIFNPTKPCKNINDRESISEDGLPISEWELSISDIDRFVVHLKEEVEKNSQI